MKKALLLILIVLIATTLASCDMGGSDSYGDGKKPDADHVHSFGDWETIVSPTCKVDGSKVRYCECGAMEEETIYSTGHTEVIDAAVDATCMTNGLTEGSHCSKCGEIFLYQKPIPAGHTEVIDAAVAPTCTTSGFSEGKHCSACGEILVEPRPVPPSHTEVIDASVAPTCTINGKTEGKHCSVCNEIIVAQTIVDALGHTEVTDEAVDPTCTNTGLTEGSHCSTCNEIFVSQNTVAAKGHTESEATMENNVAPTCVLGGSYDSVVYCEICDMELRRSKITVDPLGHTEVTDEAVAPTCTKTGLTEGSHCLVCNKVLVKQTSVNKISHEYVDYVCSECGAQLTPTSNSYFKFTELSDGTYSVAVQSSNNISGTVIIPSVYNNMPVTAIAQYGFNSCYRIQKVVIPDSVIKIGKGAFEGCRTLTDITFGKNSKLELIEYRAFGGLNIVSISIPENASIGEEAFYNCNSLTNIIIPDTVTSISKNAFDESAYYENESNWIDGVLYIGNHLIKAKSTVSGEYSIKDGTVVIADYAFYQCTTLTGLVIPDSVTTVGNYAFESCIGLKSIDFSDNITYIGRYAFNWCSALPNIALPKKVAYIGSGAFSNCSKFTEITIPSTVSYLGYHAFYDCKKLTKVIIHSSEIKVDVAPFEGCKISNATIPASVIQSIPKSSLITLNITSGASINNSAFKDCTTLRELTIGDSVASIGKEAFYGCSALRTVVIGNGVTSIGSNAFYGCPIHVVSLPSSAIEYIPKTQLTTLSITSGSSIDDNAFKDCTKLSYVSIAGSITAIADTAFAGCKSIAKINIKDISAWCNLTGSIPHTTDSQLYLNGNLIADLVIPDGVTSIKNSAFSGFTNITSVTIPDSVTAIGDSAFSGCTGITSVTIPDSVTSIGASAFYDCTSLATVTIPCGITSIGAKAFYNCNLDSIIKGNTEYYRAYYVEENCLIERSTNTLIVGSNNSIIPTDVVAIGDYAFYGRTKMTSIAIPKSVTSIGSYAFSYCESLSNVTFEYNSNCKSIGFSAFSADRSLAEINLPNSVESIGAYAFANCTSLANNPLHNSVTSIGDYAFYRCTSLMSIYIPDSVTSIGIGAFSDCTELEGVYLGNKITVINEKTFSGCTSLMSITIPDNVKSINAAAFQSCTQLSNVNIRDGVTFVADDAFLGCQITSITAPIIAITKIPKNSLESIVITSGNNLPDSAFRDCDSLINVEIGDNVIGDVAVSAFRECDNLVSVDIGNGITSIGNTAFYGCTSLASVEIGNSVTNVGQAAFDGCNPALYTESDGVKYVGSENHPYSVLISVTDKSSTTYEIEAGSTRIIAYGAFSGCSRLYSITIPDGVKNINSYAFSGCTLLCRVVISDGVASIGDSAFKGCTNLTDVKIPDGITVIDRSTFQDCTSLTEIDIPNSVITIGNSAFEGCTSLTEIDIPNSVTTIGNYAFEGCTSLTSVVIPDSVTSIGSYAFYECTGLKSVVIGDGVTNIGNSAFRYCNFLRSVVFKDTAKSWAIDNTSTVIQVTDPEITAVYLSNSYAVYSWSRK